MIELEDDMEESADEGVVEPFVGRRCGGSGGGGILVESNKEGRRCRETLVR